MCHERWLRRSSEEREASRRLWDEFDQTRPLSELEATEPESQTTLEQAEPAPLAADH